MIYEGYVEEGLRIVKAVRERHDGIERSPWNEVECGRHYARSLASYGVLLALSGFFCDAVNKKLYFNPAIDQDDFQCFFCCNDGWGIYSQKKEAESGEIKRSIETLYGDLSEYTNDRLISLIVAVKSKRWNAERMAGTSMKEGISCAEAAYSFFAEPLKIKEKMCILYFIRNRQQVHF